jgi:uncharacterized protein YggT (Ycf19 family)
MWRFLSNIVRDVLYILEGLLLTRLILPLIPSLKAPTLTIGVSKLTNPLVAPFTPLFNQALRIDWAALVAMAIYALVAWALHKLFEIAEETNNSLLSKDMEDAPKEIITTAPQYFEDEDSHYRNYSLGQQQPRLLK